MHWKMKNAAYRKLYPELHDRYLGQVVAIYAGRLVDVDPDFETLYLRVQKQYGNQTVLIRRVGDTPVEEYHFRSPRLEQAP